MVRATATEVVKKWGGVYPPPYDATSVGNICTQADAELDARAAPSTLGTGTNEAEFANEYVWRKINYMRWAAGPMRTPAPLNPWSEDMQLWFNRLLSNTTKDSTTTVKRV